MTAEQIRSKFKNDLIGPDGHSIGEEDKFSLFINILVELTAQYAEANVITAGILQCWKRAEGRDIRALELQESQHADSAVEHALRVKILSHRAQGLQTLEPNPPEKG